MQSINRANQIFWNEVCGSHLAHVLGITDNGPESLRKYDKWYFNYYPYLLESISNEKPSGKRILEIGLGYGSVGQMLARTSGFYLGLDLSAGPVALMRHRLAQTGLSGDVRQCTFPKTDLLDDSFDLIISIGCYHHTGNISGCISETHRLLRPGGVALIMVYNRHSYRHFIESPIITSLSVFRSIMNTQTKVVSIEKEKFLDRYDTNSNGEIAPYTEFIDISQAKLLFNKFKKVKFWKENCADEIFLGKLFKRDAIRPFIGPLAGTDLYIRAEK